MNINSAGNSRLDEVVQNGGGIGELGVLGRGTRAVLTYVFKENLLS